MVIWIDRESLKIGPERKGWVKVLDLYTANLVWSLKAHMLPSAPLGVIPSTVLGVKPWVLLGMDLHQWLKWWSWWWWLSSQGKNTEWEDSSGILLWTPWDNKPASWETVIRWGVSINERGLCKGMRTKYHGCLFIGHCPKGWWWSSQQSNKKRRVTSRTFQD